MGDDEAGIDPLSPDSVLIFGAGALTGTNAPSSGRMTVTFKSPATNLYAKSTAGGHWGAELKFAGYDNIVILGSSNKPVYLWINNEHVEIKNAEKIWGKDVRETDKTIKEELGEEEIMRAGRRIVTLERCFNVREGASRKDDVLPYRLMNEPAPSGPVKGMMNLAEELNKMLYEYYLLHKWDTETGWPTAEILEKLNLQDVAIELEKLGRIPRKKKRKK